jgi:hypothetical protein
MDVTIGESGKESGVAEIDSCGVFGSVILDLFPRTNFLDALPVGQNALIEQVASTLDVKHAPRFDQHRSWREGVVRIQAVPPPDRKGRGQSKHRTNILAQVFLFCRSTTG